MPDIRVHALVLVHGAPVALRFDDDNAFERFKQDVRRGQGVSRTVNTKLIQVTGQQGDVIYLRPSSVDLIMEGKA